MIPYILMFSITVIHAFLNNQKTKYISLVAFCFVILFYSFRQNVGSDWHHYEYYFNNIFSSGPDLYNFEVGYRLLNIIFASIFNSFRSLVLVVGILNGILFWKATNHYSKNLGLALLLSVYFLFYPTLEAFRQSIPLFLFYYSLKYINTNKTKYFLVNGIGIFFHYTGMIAILFYFFHSYKKIKWGFIIFLLIYSFSEPMIYRLISIFPSVASKYYWYFVVKAVENPILSFKILEGILILLTYYFVNKKVKIQKNEYVRISISLVSLGLLLQVTLGRVSNIVYRLTYYTDIGIILFCIILYDKLKQPIYKFLYVVIIILYVTARFWRIFPFDDPRFFYNF